MERLWKDVRFGLRTFLRAPTFTAAAVLSLGLGIGLNSTIFTLVNTLFLNPLPVDRPSELVAVYTVDAKNNSPFSNLLQVSYPNYKDFRDTNSVFSDLAAYSFPNPVSFSMGGEPEQVFVEMVSGNYFHTLGVTPALGRFFGPPEDRAPGAAPVIVISYSLWQRKFGGAPDVVNKTVSVNGTPFTIVGVAADGFRGVNSLFGPDGWTPTMMYQCVLPLQFRDWLDERRALIFSLAGRLKPGATIDQARSNLATIAKTLEQEYPTPNEGRTTSVRALAEATIFPGIRDVLLMGGVVLMVIVGLVLLIACSNVANLLLARATSRRQEVAMRLALGASRGRLLRQLMTESVLLSLLGGAAGLLLAVWGKDLIWSARPPFLGFSLVDPQMDMRVFLYTLGVALVTGVIFGLAPALAGSRADVVTALKDQSRSAGQRRRTFGLGNLLIVGQVALSLVALVTAALFLRSSRAASQIDPGFDTEHTAIMQVSPGQAGYTGDRVLRFYRDVNARLGTMGGIRSVSWSANLPLFGGISRSVFIEGRENDKQASGILTLTNIVDIGYFETMGVPILQGRDFTDADRDGSMPVAIINDTMARKYWPNEEALGKRFRFYTEQDLRQVIGIARTAKYVTLGELPQPAAYIPLRQAMNDAMVLNIRAEGRPEAVLGTVQREIRQMDSRMPIQNASTVAGILDQSLFAVKLGAALLGVFGLLALGLACVGLYGVMAYSVGQRTKEIGLRMALGAPQSHVLAIVMRQGMALVGIGVVLGLAGSFWISGYMGALLFGSSRDPVSFLVASGALLLVAAFASFLPARRASRVDPLVALREG
ncbi:MAG TPA: ABC transporter permease [Vicinamibacterales bacterium]|nr:ABC transporter permease [Vicinamibacterales bacterium]